MSVWVRACGQVGESVCVSVREAVNCGTLNWIKICHQEQEKGGKEMRNFKITFVKGTRSYKKIFLRKISPYARVDQSNLSHDIFYFGKTVNKQLGKCCICTLPAAHGPFLLKFTLHQNVAYLLRLIYFDVLHCCTNPYDFNFRKLP